MKSSEVPPGVAGQGVSSEKILPWGAPCDCMLTRQVFAALGHLRTQGLRLYPSTLCPDSGALVVRGYAPTFYVRQLVISSPQKANIRYVDRINVAGLAA